MNRSSSKQSIELESDPGADQKNKNRPRRNIGMTVATRQQAPEEQRRFESALELLLSELVRQEISRRKEGLHESTEATQR